MIVAITFMKTKRKRLICTLQNEYVWNIYKLQLSFLIRDWLSQFPHTATKTINVYGLSGLSVTLNYELAIYSASSLSDVANN